MSEEPKVSLFKNKNFALVFWGAFVSEVGAMIYSFAVSFYILDITGNNAFLQGLYLAVCGAVLLLATPVGGVLGDRYNKAKIMYLCDYVKGGMIVVATVLMLVFSSPSAHLYILFAIGVLGNAVSGIFSPASAALLPYIVAEDQLQQANSFFSVKRSVQSILGVVVAGVLYTAFPITTLFFAVGVSYLLSGVSEMFIRYRYEKAEGKLTVRFMLSDVKEGLKYVRSNKALTVLITAVLFINFFFTPLFQNFLPYFIKTDVAPAPRYLFDSFLEPELWTSVFSMLIGVSSLIASVILSTKKQEDKCGIRCARKLCAVAALMLLLTAAYRILVAGGVSLDLFLILFALICVALGLLIVFINIPFDTAVMRITDVEKLSKVSGITSMMSQGLTPISAVLAGAMLDYCSSTLLLLVCASGFTFAALFMLFNRHTREI